MANFLEQIKVVLETDTSKVTAGFKNVQQEVQQAEGKFNKLKTAGGGIFDTLKQNAGLALAGAGAAVGTFAVSAVGDFQDLALNVDKFTQKTGVSADAASRWIEVSDDLGISADTVATAFGKFEKNDAAGKLDEFGLSAKGANDRFIEMLTQISKIPDANQRAATAFKVFGKSWQELAPLLDSTTNLKQRLDEVSGSKLIDEKEIAKARQFRDDMDRLSDAADNLKLSIGEALLPFLDTLAQIAAPLAEFIGKLQEAKKRADEKPSDASWTDKVVGFFTTTGPEAADFWLNKIDEVTGGTGDRFGQTKDAVAQLGDVVENGSQKFLILANATMNVSDKTDEQIAALRAQALAGEDSATAMGDAAAAQKEAQDAADKLNKSLADQATAVKAAYDSTFALKDAQDKMFTATVAATQASQDATKSDGEKAAAARDAEQATENYAVRLAEQKTAQQEAAGATVDAAGKQRNFVLALIDTASTMAPDSPIRQNLLALANDINNKLPADKKVAITVNTTDEELRATKLIYDALRDKTVKVTVIPSGQFKMGAQGATVNAFEPIIVGEKGTELFIPTVPGEIVPHGVSITKSIARSTTNPTFMDAEGNRIWTVPVKQGEPPVIPPLSNGFRTPGSTYVLNVYMPPGSDGQDVVDALKQYERRNGFVPVRTLAA